MRGHVIDGLKHLADRADGLTITCGLYAGRSPVKAAILMDAPEKGMHTKGFWGG